MLLKIHRASECREVVGICDRELVERTFKEGEITLFISESFFGNQPVSEDEVIRVLSTSDNITIFGKRCVDLAIRQGVVEPESCLMVEGIPYVTVVQL